MDRQTSQINSGVAGLTVLGLLTVAFVAGQAEANLAADVAASAAFDRSDNTVLVLRSYNLGRIQKLPQMLDTFLAFPMHVEQTLEPFVDKVSNDDIADANEPSLHD